MFLRCTGHECMMTISIPLKPYISHMDAAMNIYHTYLVWLSFKLMVHCDIIIFKDHYFLPCAVTWGTVSSCHSMAQYNMVFHKSGQCRERRFSIHSSDVIMGAVASQITGDWIVYSTVSSGGDHRKHQSSSPRPCEGNSPVTGRGKCFHLMTSSCSTSTYWPLRDMVVILQA